MMRHTIATEKRRWPQRVLGLTLSVVFAGVAGCSSGPQVDVASAVQVTEVTSGWFDAGIDELGRNKLVPTVSVRLENAGSEQLGLLQINGIFRRVGEDTEWGNTLVRAVGTEGLNPGAATDALVLRSPLGYTGEQPRMEMLTHKDFVDVKVELFAKHRSAQWVKLNEYVIERQLLTE